MATDNSAMVAAWIGVGGSIIGGFIGALVAWIFARQSAHRDRLLTAYGEWAAACHEMLVQAQGIGAAVEDEIRRDPNCTYEVAAVLYLGSKRGEIHYREYADAHRQLQLAEFKVASVGDRNLTFVEAVIAITTEAQKINVWKLAPDIRKPMGYLVAFTTTVMPNRFGLQGWSRLGQVLAVFRDWILEGVARDVGATEKSTVGASAQPKQTEK